MDHKVIKIIISHMNEMGVSKKEIAEKSGVLYHNVKRILNGKKIPNIKEIESMLGVFNLKIRSYIGHKDDPHFELISMIETLDYETAEVSYAFIHVIRKNKPA